MRKRTFVRTLSCCFRLICLIALGLIRMQAFAQDAAPAAMPTDPKELMLLAAKSNGLTGDDQKPWHIKFTFTLFDENLKETNHGTYEEYWAGPRQYKIIKTDAKFSETDYGTEHGLVRGGEVTDIPGTFGEISREFLQPLPYINIMVVPETVKREIQTRDFGKTKLRCIFATYPAVSGHSINLYGPTACLDMNVPALRVYGPVTGGETLIFNSIAIFNGRYVARDIEGQRDGKKDFTARLDILESADSLNEALFTPPPDAQPLAQATPLPVMVPPQAEAPKTRTITISAGVAQGQLIKASPPEYPLYALEMRITGTVVLQATIGTDGHVHNAHTVSGPDELRDAAVDAVKRWVYKPYMLNGQPVEILTTINVMFRLNH